VQHMYADVSLYGNKFSSSRCMGSNFHFKIRVGTASNPLVHDNSTPLASICEIASAIPLPPSPDLTLASVLPDPGYASWGALVQQGFKVSPTEPAVVHAPIHVNIGAGPSTAPITYMVPAEKVTTLWLRQTMCFRCPIASGLPTAALPRMHPGGTSY
jgi:hypothetical protein